MQHIQLSIKAVNGLCLSSKSQLLSLSVKEWHMFIVFLHERQIEEREIFVISLLHSGRYSYLKLRI